jgi:hypothetical protein
VPPISPIISTACVCGSRSNIARQSTKSTPLTGSPPMPIASTGRAQHRQLVRRLVGQRSRTRHRRRPCPPCGCSRA